MTACKIGTLKLNLMSATKQKILKESQVHKLRNEQRSVSEELSLLNTESKLLKQQLEELKDTLTQISHQISMIDICNASEMTKIQTQISNLHEHRKGFQSLFDKERHLLEIYNKEVQERDAAEQEVRRQEEQRVMEKNEQQARETAAIEEECISLERECIVLKKRNTAIMLKLRRKLVETENVRRDLLKRKDSEECYENDRENKVKE